VFGSFTGSQCTRHMVGLLLAFVGRAVAAGLCHLAYQDWLKVRLIGGCWLRNVVYAIIAVRSRSVLQKERKDLCMYYRIDTTFVFPNGSLETHVSSSEFY